MDQSKGKNIRILKKNLINNMEDTLAVEEYDLK